MPPSIEVTNYEQVYEHYASRDISQPLARAVHAGAALLYHPRVTYSAEAETMIKSHLDEGGRLILASNHINMFDQLPIAAYMLRSPTLRPMIGNTVAWAKQPYFAKGWLRPALDAVGGIPVWRAQDVADGMPRRERTQLVEKLFEATAQRMADGSHLFLFPEGTRNSGELHQLGKIQSGVGRVAVLAAQRIQDKEQHNWAKLLIVPTALWYGDDKPKGSLRPHLYVHKPFMVTPRTMPRAVTERLTTAMADSLEHARACSAYDAIRS